MVGAVRAQGDVDVAFAMDTHGETVWAAWAVTLAGRVTLYPPRKMPGVESAPAWLAEAGGDPRRLGLIDRRGRARLLVETGANYLQGMRLARALAGSRAWLRYQPTFVWLHVTDTDKVRWRRAEDGCVMLAKREIEATANEEMGRGTVPAPNGIVTGTWDKSFRSVLYPVAKEDEPASGLRLAVQIAVWSAVEHAARRERAELERARG